MNFYRRMRTQDHSEKKRPHTFICILFFLSHSFVLIPASQSEEIHDTSPHEKNILFINSYHRGDSWGDAVENGLRDKLSTSPMPITLSITYLDTLQHPLEAIQENIAELFKLKKMTSSFDLIVVSDESAFHFARHYQNELFKDAPLIYASLFEPSSYPSSMTKNTTGISQKTDYQTGIEIALSLHPNTEHLYFIGHSLDEKNSHQMTYLKESLLPLFEKKYSMNIINDPSQEAIYNTLSHLPKNSLVFALNERLRKKEGSDFTPAETARFLSSVTPHPVYTFWDSHLGHGVVGGLIITGYHQGKAAGQLALQILETEQNTPLPKEKTAPAVYVVDQEMIDKYGIDKGLLPEGADFINEKKPIWEEYKYEVVSCIAIFFTLISFILSFLLFTRRQKETIIQINDEKTELTHALDLNQESLQDITQHLEEVSTLDDLTGLSNKRYFNEMLVKELRRTIRHNNPVTLLLLSFDNYSSYLHHFGNEITRRHVRQVGILIAETCQRSSDLLAYFEKGHFAILLPHTNKLNALVVAERLQNNIRQQQFTSHTLEKSKITLSIGVSSLEDPHAKMNSESILKTTDALRLEAEQQGGNRICSDIQDS